MFFRISFIFLFLVSFQTVQACSCSPWSNDFYQNVSQSSINGVIRLDSAYILTDPTTNYQLPMYVFSLIRGFNFEDKNDGDTLHLFGQDGVNCAINMDFNIGDTLVVALGKEPTIFSSQAVHFIPFFGSGCGVHYLRIHNGLNDGLTIQEIEQKINTLNTNTLSQNELRISPNPFEDKITIHAIFPNSLDFNTSKFDLEISNSQGQIVYSEKNVFGEKTIETSQLSNGFFMVIIKGTNGVLMKSKMLKY